MGYRVVKRGDVFRYTVNLWLCLSNTESKWLAVLIENLNKKVATLKVGTISKGKYKNDRVFEIIKTEINTKTYEILYGEIND